MKQFHAHIYYQDHEMLAIKQLRQKAVHSPLIVWQLFEHCVGPHVRPMLELHFDETSSELALTWLRRNQANFSVLIHEDTGDDVRDHERALWLGQPLPIRYDFFNEVKLNPSIAIHHI